MYPRKNAVTLALLKYSPFMRATRRLFSNLFTLKNDNTKLLYIEYYRGVPVNITVTQPNSIFPSLPPSSVTNDRSFPPPLLHKNNTNYWRSDLNFFPYCYNNQWNHEGCQYWVYTPVLPIVVGMALLKSLSTIHSQLSLCHWFSQYLTWSKRLIW